MVDLFMVNQWVNIPYMDAHEYVTVRRLPHDSTFSKVYSPSHPMLRKSGEARVARHGRRSLRLDLTEIYGSLMNPQVI